MSLTQVLRRVVIPAAALVSEGKKQSEHVCKPSELPIYTPERGTTLKKTHESQLSEPGAIEQTFAQIRKTLTTITCEIKAYQRVGEDYIAAGIDNAEWLLEYLAEENNTTPKYGAIAIGALTGFIFGLRGGFFKRTLYASTGALGMAAICYPKEAKEYSAIGLAEAKKYATIGYNFVYGVKKDDPPLELPSLPKLPSSVSEAWDIASDIGKSASTFVTGKETTKSDQDKK